jgi:hypothetical protein
MAQSFTIFSFSITNWNFKNIPYSLWFFWKSHEVGYNYDCLVSSSIVVSEFFFSFQILDFIVSTFCDFSTSLLVFLWYIFIHWTALIPYSTSSIYGGFDFTIVQKQYAFTGNSILNFKFLSFSGLVII